MSAPIGKRRVGWAGRRGIVVRVDAGVALAIVVSSLAGTPPVGDRQALARVVAAPPARGSILFERGGNQFYAIDAVGGQLKLVLPNAAAAKWSPDGRWLMFVRKESDDSSYLERFGLYVMKANGSSLRRLTEIQSPYTPYVSWSADGRKLGYDSRGWIYVIGIDGRGKARLTRGGGPVWSPNGRWIAFLGPNTSRNERGLFVIRPDGTGRRQLVFGVPASASWSPDGKRLAFGTCCGTEGVGVVDLRGHVRMFGKGGITAAWSPDGRWIAMVAGVIQLIRPDGTGLHTVGLPGYVPSIFGPTWSPDSRALTVDAGPEAAPYSTSDIWVVTIDGRYSSRLTEGWRYGYGSYYPEWQPANLPTAALAGRFVSPGNPTDSVVQKGVLEATHPIANLAADGQRVAVDYSGVYASEAWSPITGGIVRFGPGGWSSRFYVPGLGPIGLAGDRVAWGHSGSGGGQDYYGISTATVEEPRSDSVKGPSDLLSNDPLGDLEGDGSLLVFGSWHVPCRLSFSSCNPGPKTDGSLYRIDGTTAIRITSSAGALTPLSVDAGRILVDHENGTIELISADGATLQTFHVYTGDFLGAKLGGSDVVVLKHASIADYDAGTGALVHEWPLATVADRRLEDVQDGLAVYVSGTEVHLLRLSDGREAVIGAPGTGPVLAQLEPGGLFYSYTADDARYPGRVAFVPFDRLPLH
jgi:hypothetical protein